MWTRAELKQDAKNVLRDFYWKAFLVGFIYVVVASIGNSITSPIFILSIVFSIFIVGPLTVGLSQYFLKQRERDVDYNYLIKPFKDGFKEAFLGMLMMYVFVFLWTLLLIIPGIVKYYAYRMVPFVLAQNPNMDWKEALDLSKEMTYGEKLNIFILDLSFLGWMILAIIPFCLGVPFLFPYIQATYTELYIKLSEKMNKNPIKNIPQNSMIEDTLQLDEPLDND